MIKLFTNKGLKCNFTFLARWAILAKLVPKVLQMVSDGYSYRKIAEKLNLSKTTVNDIVKRHRQSAKKLELDK